MRYPISVELDDNSIEIEIDVEDCDIYNWFTELHDEDELIDFFIDVLEEDFNTREHSVLKDKLEERYKKGEFRANLINYIEDEDLFPLYGDKIYDLDSDALDEIIMDNDDYYDAVYEELNEMSEEYY